MVRPRAASTLIGALAVVAGLAVATRITAAPRGGEDPEPPATLTETGLYLPGPGLRVDPRNRPFSPQYPLWTDGAAKQRWIWLPPGTVIDARDERAWVLPVGAKLWKEFRLGGRPVETRLLWRATADRWVAAAYAWNAEGTEARLAPAAGLFADVDVAPGRPHLIPSVAECRACHESPSMRPLGFNALQLSPERDPMALHGEPIGAADVTLATLVEGGLLHGARADLLADPPRIRARTPDARAAAGYLVGNCGHCHNRDTRVPTLGASLNPADVDDADALIAAMTAQASLWQVPGAEPGRNRILDPGRPDRSALLVRMASRRPSSQMPAIGTSVADVLAIETVTRWIRQGSR